MTFLSRLQAVENPLLRVIIYWLLSFSLIFLFAIPLLLPLAITNQQDFLPLMGLASIALGFVSSGFICWSLFGQDGDSVTLGLTNSNSLKGLIGFGGTVVGTNLFILLLAATGIIGISGSITLPDGYLFILKIMVLTGLTVLIEGLLFRGFALQSVLADRKRESFILVLSFVYMLLHIGNPGYGISTFLNIFLIGLWLSYATLAAGTLWYSVGIHAGLNMTQSLLYGIEGFSKPDWSPFVLTVGNFPEWLSGNSFGIESSLLLTPVILFLIRWERLRWLRS